MILLMWAILTLLCAASNSDAKHNNQIRYHYIELGTLGGQYSWSTGINNWGQVVGVSELENGEYRGFLWTGRQLNNLGSLDNDIFSVAWSINERGEVVGFSLGLHNQRQAILWDRGGMHVLETLGGTSADAVGINNHGEIAGWSLTSENLFHASLWNSEGIIDLAPPEGIMSWASSINRKGSAVGAYVTSDERVHAVMWDRDGMQDLGALGGEESEAYWINDKGQAVGWCDMPGSLEWHACLWDSNGDTVDLGTAGGLNSEAFAINDHGQIVGLYYPGASLDVTQAFLWSKKHGMVNLDTMADLPEGVSLASANSINDFGWITGMTDEGIAYLLIPYRSDKRMGHHETHPHPRNR